MKEVCIIAYPRTGTNYMCSLWKHFERHEALREIFHPRQSHSLRPFLPDLNAAFGLNAEDIDDPALTAALRDDPLRTLSALTAACEPDGTESISYKIFPAHLQDDRLERLFARDNMVVVVVRRILIDSFISRMKAQKLMAWTHTDTTDVAVEISFGAFQAWAAERRAW